MSNLQPGTYKARATSVQFGVVERTGNEYIRIGFDIEFDDATSESISADLYFTKEKNTARSIESLRYCGWTGVDLSQLEIGVDGMGDSHVNLVLDLEPYEDEEGHELQRLRVKWINRVGAASVAQPMSDQQKASFAARMKGLLMADAKKNGAPKQAAAPSPQHRTTNGAAHRPAPPPAAPKVDDYPPGWDDLPPGM